MARPRTARLNRGVSPILRSSIQFQCGCAYLFSSFKILDAQGHCALPVKLRCAHLRYSLSPSKCWEESESRVLLSAKLHSITNSPIRRACLGTTTWLTMICRRRARPLGGHVGPTLSNPNNISTTTHASRRLCPIKKAEALSSSLSSRCCSSAKAA